MWGDAYWFNYKNQELIKVPKGDIHSEYVIDNPDTFGLNRSQFMQWALDGFHDTNFSWPLDEIMRKGWFRVHKYRDFLAVDLHALNSKSKDGMYDLIKKMSIGPDTKVMISEIGGGRFNVKTTSVTARYFLSGEAFNESIREGKDVGMLRAVFGVAMWYNPKTDKIIKGEHRTDTHYTIIRDRSAELGLSEKHILELTPEACKTVVRDSGWYQVHFYPEYLTIQIADRFNKRVKENIYDLLTKLRVDPSVEVIIEHRQDYEQLKASDFYDGNIFEAKVKDPEFGDSMWYKPNIGLIRSNDKQATHSSIIYEKPKYFNVTKAEFEEDQKDPSSYYLPNILMTKGWFRVHVMADRIAIECKKNWDKNTKNIVFDILNLIKPSVKDNIIVDCKNDFVDFDWGEHGEILESKLNENHIIWFDSKHNNIEYVPPSSTHDQFLFAHPDVFGVDKKTISFGDSVVASESALRKGWIQVHMYPSYLSVRVYKYDAKTKYAIFNLIHKLNYLGNKKIVIDAVVPRYFYLETDTDDLLSPKLESKFKRLLS